MNSNEKKRRYTEVIGAISALIDKGEDEVAAMATIVGELHNTFDYFHWTGFYRCVRPDVLKIGPYQGAHGCLTIPFGKGVCGKAAREKQTQLIEDIQSIPFHIACSSETRSEIVVPVLDSRDQINSVLDIDSHQTAAFNDIDRKYLEQVAVLFRERILL